MAPPVMAKLLKNFVERKLRKDPGDTKTAPPLLKAALESTTQSRSVTALVALKSTARAPARSKNRDIKRMTSAVGEVSEKSNVVKERRDVGCYVDGAVASDLVGQNARGANSEVNRFPIGVDGGARACGVSDKSGVK